VVRQKGASDIQEKPRPSKKIALLYLIMSISLGLSLIAVVSAIRLFTQNKIFTFKNIVSLLALCHCSWRNSRLEEEHKMVNKQIWGTIQSGGVWEGEFINKPNQGELHWEFASIPPDTDEDGEMTHFVALKTDTTSRERVEQDLSWLASFLELNPMPVLEADWEGELKYLNPFIRELFPDLKSLGINHPFLSGWEEIVENIRQAPYARITREVRVENRFYQQSIHYLPQTRRLRVFGMDITELKLEEETLRGSEEKFRLLVQGVQEYAIFMLDPQGRVASWNDGAQRIKGWAADEVIGQPFSWFYPPEAIAASHPQHVLEQAASQGRYEEEGWRIRKDQSRFWAQVSLTALYDEQGGLRGFAEITRDATERKQQEEMLARSAQELEQSNRYLQEFAFIASHDLQEPLRKIEKFAQILLEISTQLEGHQRSYVERMSSAAGRMRNMVEGLLQLSRVQSQGQPFERVNLSTIVAEVLTDLELQIQHSGGSVEVGELPEVEGDPLQLRQLMQNLIGNALKYHHPNMSPVVKIHARQSPRKVQVLVEDHGIGFKPEDVKRMFQPFQRLVGRSEYEGSGMGLAICRKIVERHGGEITALGEPGKGASFMVSLPLQHSNV